MTKAELAVNVLQQTSDTQLLTTASRRLRELAIGTLLAELPVPPEWQETIQIQGDVYLRHRNDGRPHEVRQGPKVIGHLSGLVVVAADDPGHTITVHLNMPPVASKAES